MCEMISRAVAALYLGALLLGLAVHLAGPREGGSAEKTLPAGADPPAVHAGFPAAPGGTNARGHSSPGFPWFLPQVPGSEPAVAGNPELDESGFPSGRATGEKAPEGISREAAERAECPGQLFFTRGIERR